MLLCSAVYVNLKWYEHTYQVPKCFQINVFWCCQNTPYFIVVTPINSLIMYDINFLNNREDFLCRWFHWANPHMTGAVNLSRDSLFKISCWIHDVISKIVSFYYACKVCRINEIKIIHVFSFHTILNTPIIP